MSEREKVWPADALAGDAAALGLRPGDRLIFHASMKSVGRLERGSDTLINALVRAVSPGGLVMCPTFNYGRGVYDPARSEAVIGAVADRFFRRDDAVRSLHPSHSVAAIGQGADEAVSGHELATCFGAGSPIWRLGERGGLLLLVGVGFRAASALHCAEIMAGLPYILGKTARTRTSVYGDEREVPICFCPGCSDGFDRVEPVLERGRMITRGRIGGAECMLLGVWELVTAAAALLARDPTALLCPEADGCERCADSRRVLREAGRLP